MRVSIEWTGKSAWDAKMSTFGVDENWVFGFHKTDKSIYVRFLGLEILWKRD